MNIFREFKKRQRELGMSATALAKRSHVSLPTVNRVLSGQHAGASFANVLSIAEALGMQLTANAEKQSDEFRHQQSMRKARGLVRLVQGTSALEGQAVDQRELDKMVKRTSRELFLTSRKLWDE